MPSPGTIPNFRAELSGAIPIFRAGLSGSLRGHSGVPGYFFSAVLWDPLAGALIHGYLTVEQKSYRFSAMRSTARKPNFLTQYYSSGPQHKVMAQV